MGGGDSPAILSCSAEPQPGRWRSEEKSWQEKDQSFEMARKVTPLKSFIPPLVWEQRKSWHPFERRQGVFKGKFRRLGPFGDSGELAPTAIMSVGARVSFAAPAAIPAPLQTPEAAGSPRTSPSSLPRNLI